MISVSDGSASASLAAFTITVQAANTPPVISGTPVTSATAGQPYSFKPTAQDANGDPLTFSIQNKPTWATFDTTNGTLYGTPAGAGSFGNIVISVSDGKASASLAAFTITVAAAQTASVTVSWVPPTTNTDGTPVTALAGFKCSTERRPDNTARRCRSRVRASLGRRGRSHHRDDLVLRDQGRQHQRRGKCVFSGSQ